MATPGDALQNQTNISQGSASDKYFAWKLMADKMTIATAAGIPAKAKAVLSAVSQKEAIKFKILEKILGVDYDESTANYAQLKDYTGKEDKLEQADWLANASFDMLKGKQIMKNLIGNEETYTAVMGRSNVEANKAADGAGIAAILKELYGAP
jgi:hypothetical protein